MSKHGGQENGFAQFVGMPAATVRVHWFPYFVEFVAIGRVATPRRRSS